MMTVSSFVRRSNSVKRILEETSLAPAFRVFLLRQEMYESSQACAVDVVHFSKIDDDSASL